ncbi:MAG: hypothetical protein RLP44_18480 [Aggregatilineales bacterium]
MPINRPTLLLAGIGVVILSVMVGFILIKDQAERQSGLAFNTLVIREHLATPEETNVQPTEQPDEATEEATTEMTPEPDQPEATKEAIPASEVPD